MTESVLVFAVALVANLLSGLSGGGAGLLQLPGLLFLGLPFPIAIATHKIATVALGVGASVRHLRAGSLDLRIALICIIFGIPGVTIGAFTILSIHTEAARTALGILTMLIGIYSISKPSLGLIPVSKLLTNRRVLLGGLGLFIIGMINGSLGSGSGLMVTLWLVSWFGLEYKRAAAHTLTLVGLTWNGTGAIILGTLGEVHWPWVPPLVLGALLGGFSGAHISILKGNTLVKRAFEITTIAVGLKLLF